MSTTITVKGMSCEHCEQTIEDALQSVAGVSDARADHETETAVVEGNPDTGRLVQTVEDVGYTAHS
jgi:copper chaperone